MRDKKLSLPTIKLFIEHCASMSYQLLKRYLICFCYKYCLPILQDDVASNILNEILKNDELSKLEKELKSEAEKTILCAAKLIAPVIEDTLTAGFAW